MGYYSRKLVPGERSLHINELETIAARDGMDHFKYILTRSTAPFTLMTESSFLYQLLNTVELKARHRILEAFGEFNFITFQLKGSDNEVADLLSRARVQCTGSRGRRTTGGGDRVSR